MQSWGRVGRGGGAWEGAGPGRGGAREGFSTTESCLRAELGLPAHCGLDQGGSESSAPPPQTPVPGARSSQTTGASVTAGPGFALSLPGSDRAQGGRVSTWTALSSPRSSEDHHAAPRRGTSHHALAPAPGGRLGLHRSRVVRPSRRQSRRRRPPPTSDTLGSASHTHTPVSRGLALFSPLRQG